LHQTIGGARSTFSQELGVTWEFFVDSGALSLAEDPEQIVIPFTGPVAPANHADAFLSGPGLLQFTRDAAGLVNGLKMSFLGMKDFRFERRTSASAGPTQGATVRSSSTSKHASLPIPSAWLDHSQAECEAVG
jgi:hypothetical protein